MHPVQECLTVFKLNYGYHNQAYLISIFETEYFSSEICHGIWKIWKCELSCDTKISKSLEKVD